MWSFYLCRTNITRSRQRADCKAVSIERANHNDLTSFAWPLIAVCNIAFMRLRICTYFISAPHNQQLVKMYLSAGGCDVSNDVSFYNPLFFCILNAVAVNAVIIAQCTKLPRSSYPFKLYIKLNNL